jgi:glutathione S-transferase
MTMYDFELDENCYKVRLFLSVLGLSYDKITVDMHPGGEEQSEAMLALNPAGGLPILVEDGVALRGAEAILLALAHRHDPARTWLPVDPSRFGEVAMWLHFAAVDLAAAVAARRNALFDAPCDAADVIRKAKRALRILDDHMTVREFDGAAWIVGEQASLAEFALFPSVALSRDYGVEHEAYPALRRWMRKVRGLPGFITMPGIPGYH